jgi:triosephosphate isomerase (TIM)
MANSKRHKLVVGNWKMNPRSMKEAKRTFGDFKKQKTVNKNVTTVFCPPFVYLNELKKSYSGTKIFFGAQDSFWEHDGAFTGEVSNAQLLDLGARFVIVGHSERRFLGETNKEVAQKAFAALVAGLHVILCVGERDRNDSGEYLKFLSREIHESLDQIPKARLGKLVIAYEPIWAIGKGKKAMNAEDMHFMKLFIQKQLIKIFGSRVAKSVPVLYGGSVNSENAVKFTTLGEADGLLIGRASLNPSEFSKIITNVSKEVSSK